MLAVEWRESLSIWVIVAFLRRTAMGVRNARENSSPSTSASEDLNPYNIAQQQFDIAAQYIDIPVGLRTWLRGSTRLIKVEFPVELDDGTVKSFSGYRAL